MSAALFAQLNQLLKKIDRPGSFCASGHTPMVLPGLEVEGLGPIGLPLTPLIAEELKKHCEQAPYGKGEETLVDTSVRRVWHLTPERFHLKNPAWQTFLQETVTKVQEQLGLEKQKLECHLYDLLLYEPGSFFLPHRDGEKLDRMVATLVIVLPSHYEGGELIVRHEGQEQSIDFTSGDDTLYRIHYAAFYADCEHEVRPLRKGHRLCLVYNLTLAKGKKGLSAPRSGEHMDAVASLLREWSQDTPGKLVITLDHQYTKDGLTWDALKGTDRVKAQVLLTAAKQADCQAYLALMTFHESGSAEYSGGGRSYGRRRSRYYDDEEDEEGDASEYEMGEVFDSDLTAEHWSDPEGKAVAFGMMNVDESEVLDPEAIQAIDPETEFEGYTGNAGMTLDRWYRHGAIVIWPAKKHFEVLCDAGIQTAIGGLEERVKEWQKARDEEAKRQKASCLEFAKAILSRWTPSQYQYDYNADKESCKLMWSLTKLDDAALVKSYLRDIMAQMNSVNPVEYLPTVCQQHGWRTFQTELELVFKNTNVYTLPRTCQALEALCLAKPKPGEKEAWRELCHSLGTITLKALEGIDSGASGDEWRAKTLKRADLLTEMTRSYIATVQVDQLAGLLTHALSLPKKYPLIAAHLAALVKLKPWLEKNVKTPWGPMNDWLKACCVQLEALTAKMPLPPKDHRRDAEVDCKCADCAELNKFLANPTEAEHRFRAIQGRRNHLEEMIKRHHCDLDCRTEKIGSPHVLVCTKNTKSYEAALKKYHEDKEHLATLRAIEAALPG